MSCDVAHSVLYRLVDLPVLRTVGSILIESFSRFSVDFQSIFGFSTIYLASVLTSAYPWNTIFLHFLGLFLKNSSYLEYLYHRNKITPSTQKGSLSSCPRSDCETRICTSLGLLMKFETLFMSDEEKNGHHFDLSLFFLCPRILGPWGYECWVCSS